MPLYEYVCPTCRVEFEELVRGDDRPACPQCGNADVEKQLSVPAAPQGSTADLPVCSPQAGGCGRPACGMGGCQMM